MKYFSPIRFAHVLRTRRALLFCISAAFLLVISSNSQAQSLEDVMRFVKARKIAKASFELAKQMDKVKSTYQYTELTKRIPTGNLGFFIMHEFNYAPSGYGNPQIYLPTPNAFASAGDDMSVFFNSSPNNSFPAQKEEAKKSQDPKELSPFMKNLGLQYGLELIGKGTKYDDSGFSSKVSLIYLQLPIHALYFYKLSKVTLFGGLGPYVAYGLGGKSKTDQDSFKAFDKENGLRRFDAGVGFTLGCWVTERVAIDLRYDLGLANLSSDHEFEKIRNRSIGINLGYQIGMPGK